MLRLKRSILSSLSIQPATLSSRIFTHGHDKLVLHSPNLPSQTTSVRFLDIHQFVNKSALDKERARLKDEINRGYFADFSELKQHGGKIAMANKIIIPEMEAVKFPSVEVIYPEGTSLQLPSCFNGNDANGGTSDCPKASLVCLSFRASSEEMIDSWSTPFLSTFGNSRNVQLYEVSFIDSWFLTLNPVKRLLLRMMKKSNPNETKGVLQRQTVYAFGDNYYFRKELKILNLLTGYIFLLDKFGRIRWQGFGLAAQEELSSLVSCTSLLLEEK